MSLATPVIIGSAAKEFAPLMVPHSIHGHITDLRKSYDILKGTHVDGMILPFNKKMSAIYNELYTAAVTQSTQNGDEIGFQDTSIIKPLDVNLPVIFSHGTMTLAPSENGENGRHQAILRNNDNSTPQIHYKTDNHIRESVSTLISKAALLAVLPNELLKSLKVNKSLIVIGDSFTEGLHDYGLLDSAQVFKLTWNEQEQIIEAGDIYVSMPPNRNSRGEENTQLIRENIKNTKNMLFVLDEKAKIRDWER